MSKNMTLDQAAIALSENPFASVRSGRLKSDRGVIAIKPTPDNMWEIAAVIDGGSNIVVSTYEAWREIINNTQSGPLRLMANKFAYRGSSTGRAPETYILWGGKYIHLSFYGGRYTGNKAQIKGAEFGTVEAEYRNKNSQHTARIFLEHNKRSFAHLKTRFLALARDILSHDRVDIMSYVGEDRRKFDPPVPFHALPHVSTRELALTGQASIKPTEVIWEYTLPKLAKTILDYRKMDRIARTKLQSNGGYSNLKACTQTFNDSQTLTELAEASKALRDTAATLRNTVVNLTNQKERIVSILTAPSIIGSGQYKYTICSAYTKKVLTAIDQQPNYYGPVLFPNYLSNGLSYDKALLQSWKNVEDFLYPNGSPFTSFGMHLCEENLDKLAALLPTATLRLLDPAKVAIEEFEGEEAEKEKKSGGSIEDLRQLIM